MSSTSAREDYLLNPWSNPMRLDLLLTPFERWGNKWSYRWNDLSWVSQTTSELRFVPTVLKGFKDKSKRGHSLQCKCTLKSRQKFCSCAWREVGDEVGTEVCFLHFSNTLGPYVLENTVKGKLLFTAQNRTIMNTPYPWLCLHQRWLL